jgi:hypothetical protein
MIMHSELAGIRQEADLLHFDVSVAENMRFPGCALGFSGTARGAWRVLFKCVICGCCDF